MFLTNKKIKNKVIDTGYGINRKRDLGFYIFSRMFVAIIIIVILFPILYIFSLSIRTQEALYSDILF